MEYNITKSVLSLEGEVFLDKDDDLMEFVFKLHDELIQGGDIDYTLDNMHVRLVERMENGAWRFVASL